MEKDQRQPERIEDAILFKADLTTECGLSFGRADIMHSAYQSFINENYELKKTKTHMDYILNKPNSQL